MAGNFNWRLNHWQETQSINRYQLILVNWYEPIRFDDQSIGRTESCLSKNFIDSKTCHSPGLQWRGISDSLTFGHDIDYHAIVIIPGYHGKTREDSDWRAETYCLVRGLSISPVRGDVSIAIVCHRLTVSSFGYAEYNAIVELQVVKQLKHLVNSTKLLPPTPPPLPNKQSALTSEIDFLIEFPVEHRLEYS